MEWLTLPWYTYTVVALLLLMALGVLWTLVQLLKGALASCFMASWVGLNLLALRLGGAPLSSSGSAHWARRWEIDRAGCWHATGIPLGRAYGRTLVEPRGGHVALFGPPRSRKSRGLIIPAIKNYKGSIVVSDMRGELFEATHTTREDMGPCYRFDPASDTSCNINLLDMVRWHTPRAFGDLHRIARHLLLAAVPDHPVSPFAEGAVPLFVAIALHCQAQGAGSLPQMVQWMVEPTTTLKAKLGQLLTSPLPLVQQGARQALDVSDRMGAAHWNAILTKLVIFQDEEVAAHTMHSDVDFDALVSGLAPISLFLCMGFADIDRFGIFLGALADSLVGLLSAAPAPRRHAVLLCLDEASNLGRLSALEGAVSYLQGCDVQCLLTFQNVQQFYHVYGPGSPLLGAVSTQVHYTPAPGDVTTAQYIAGPLGVSTVLASGATSSVGRSAGWSGTGPTAGSSATAGSNTRETGRPLLTVDEILRFPERGAIILHQATAPILAEKLGMEPLPHPVRMLHAVARHPGVVKTALAATLLLVSLWPLRMALQPVWTTPPTVLASLESHPALASMLPTAAPPPSSQPGPSPDPESPLLKNSSASPVESPPPTPAALAPMDPGQSPSPQGPPEPRALHPGMLVSKAPVAGTSRWELKIRVGDRPTPELHRHAQTQGACERALEELRTERQARRDGERITWERRLFHEAIKLSAWCEEHKG